MLDKTPGLYMHLNRLKRVLVPLGAPAKGFAEVTCLGAKYFFLSGDLYSGFEKCLPNRRYEIFVFWCIFIRHQRVNWNEWLRDHLVCFFTLDFHNPPTKGLRHNHFTSGPGAKLMESKLKFLTYLISMCYYKFLSGQSAAVLEVGTSNTRALRENHWSYFFKWQAFVFSNLCNHFMQGKHGVSHNSYT